MRGDPEAVANALGLKRSGGEWKGPCPQCGGHDRFHIRRGRHHDLILHCRAGCQFGDLAGILRALGVIEDDREKWQTFEVDGDNLEDFLRAFVRCIDRRVPIHSRWRFEARRAVEKITGLKPDEFLDAYLYCECVKSDLAATGMFRADQSIENYKALSTVIEGREWIAKGCIWLI